MVQVSQVIDISFYQVIIELSVTMLKVGRLCAAGFYIGFALFISLFSIIVLYFYFTSKDLFFPIKQQ
jgi:hypothetical protein